MKLLTLNLNYFSAMLIYHPSSWPSCNIMAQQLYTLLRVRLCSFILWSHDRWHSSYNVPYIHKYILYWASPLGLFRYNNFNNIYNKNYQSTLKCRYVYSSVILDNHYNGFFLVSRLFVAPTAFLFNLFSRSTGAWILTN